MELLQGEKKGWEFCHGSVLMLITALTIILIEIREER